MKTLKFYKDMDKMREYRKRSKKNNYKRGNFIEVPYIRYTGDEDWELLFSDKSDRQIAMELKRSVESIQLRRWKILSGKVNSSYSLKGSEAI